MKKNISKLFIVLPIMLAILLSGLGVDAGVSTSGGGYAVVCYTQQGQIESVELLDLFEARRIYNLTLIKSSGNLVADIMAGTRNTYWLQREMVVKDVATLEFLNLNIQSWLNTRVWVNTAQQLPKISDLGDVGNIRHLWGPRCRLEQIAFMDDKTLKVHILKPLWDRMNSLNQAALIKHEMFYNISRNYIILPLETSEFIRKSIGLMYTANKIPSAISGIPKGLKPHMILHDPNAKSTGRWDSTAYYSFPIRKSSNGAVFNRYQFTYVAGRIILTPTYVDMPQQLTLGARYQLNSFQLNGWYLVAMPDRAPGKQGVLLRLFNDKGMTVVDLR
ncbi:MAG: hypothetical protein JNL11_02430 [Bdellovibrionaceae bacterium]|nr:hypothetical protein [Pseudobdellovibrionaceae bacterium]